MAARDLVFNLIGNDRVSKAFRNAGSSAQKAADRMGDLQGRMDKMSGATTAITSGMKIAGAASAAFSAVAASAALVVASGAAVMQAGMLGVTAAVLGAGIAIQAKFNPAVKKAFGDLKDNVLSTMKEISAPLAGPLVEGAKRSGEAFDILAVSLAKIYKQAAPLLTGFFNQLPAIARELGPLLEFAFAKSAPTIKAFTDGIAPAIERLHEFMEQASKTGPVLKDKLLTAVEPLKVGFVGFIDEIKKGGPALEQAARAGIDGFGKLLPAIGKLAVALLPIITILQKTLIPGFTNVANVVADTLGPAIQKVADFFVKNSTAAKVLGTVLAGLVVGIAAVSAAMKIAGAAMAVYRGIVVAISAATKIWTAVQAAFNIVMALNPVTLIVLGIIALIAVIVLIATKTKFFQTVWAAVWGAIKTAASATWEFIKKAVSKGFAFVKNLFLNFTGPGLMIKHWDKIKKTISNAWSAIKSATSKALSAIGDFFVRRWTNLKNNTRNAFNAVKGFITGPISSARTTLANLVDRMVSKITGIRGRIAGRFSGMFDGIRSAFFNAINAVIYGWNRLSFSLPSIDLGPLGRIGGFTLNTPNIPYLAQGGIVDRATLAMIGEAGPEAVIPLDKLDQFTGPRVIHVVLSAEQISQLQRGRQIQADLDAYKSAGGRVRS